MMPSVGRPNYLAQGRDDSKGVWTAICRLLTREGVIEAALRDEALAQPRYSVTGLRILAPALRR